MVHSSIALGVGQKDRAFVGVDRRGISEAMVTLPRNCFDLSLDCLSCEGRSPGQFAFHKTTFWHYPEDNGFILLVQCERCGREYPLVVMP